MPGLLINPSDEGMLGPYIPKVDIYMYSKQHNLNPQHPYICSPLPIDSCHASSKINYEKSKVAIRIGCTCTNIKVVLIVS